MKKWGFLCVIVVLGVAVYVWQDDEFVAENQGFEQSVSIPKVKSPDAPVAHKPVQTKKPQKSPSEVAIAFDKTIDSQIAAKFEPKARGPSSLAAYFGTSEVQVNRRQYLISHELRSIAQEDYETFMGPEVLHSNGHVFFEANDNNVGLPALLNTRNKSLALVTGRVLLREISLADASDVAARYGAVLDQSMAHLGIYAFVAGPNAIEVVGEIAGSELEIFEGRIHEK